MKAWMLIALAGLVAGCAVPLKEVAMGEKNTTTGAMEFVVNRDIVNTRAVTPQNILNGDFHCTILRSAQTVAELKQRFPGIEFSRFDDCTPLALHAAKHNYHKSVTGPAMEPVVAIGKSLLYSGTAAYVGHEIGRGLGRSGDNVTQQGGNGGNADGGSVNMNNGNTTTRSIRQTNTNNIDVR